MYFLKHRFTQSEVIKIKELFEPKLKGLNYLDEVIDDKVFPIKSNGVFMIGSVKPTCKSGKAHFPLAIVGEDVEKLDPCVNLIKELYLTEIYADDCYISTNVVHIEGPAAKIVQRKKKTAKTYIYSEVENDFHTLKEDWNFNLDYF